MICVASVYSPDGGMLQRLVLNHITDGLYLPNNQIDYPQQYPFVIVVYRVFKQTGEPSRKYSDAIEIYQRAQELNITIAVDEIKTIFNRIKQQLPVVVDISQPHGEQIVVDAYLPDEEISVEKGD